MLSELFRSLVAGLLLAACIGAAKSEPMSREFKVALRLEPFLAGQADASRQRYVDDWTRWIKSSQGADVRAKLKLDKSRSVQFLDVRGSCDLRAAQFILRARDDDKGRQRLTLKTRSPDAAWVKATDISAPGEAAVLEEDINLGKRQLSRSVTVKLDKGESVPSSIGTASRSLPALSRLGRDGSLERVSGLLIQEQVYALPSWKINGTPIEADMSFWSDPAGTLLFAEASFSYEVPTSGAETVAQAAQALFDVMASQESWVETGRTTKTEWVYTHEAGFCR